MLLTDVHRCKRNLDEQFSKLINNKIRIAVSAKGAGFPELFASHTTIRAISAPGSPQLTSSIPLPFLPSLGQ